MPPTTLSFLNAMPVALSPSRFEAVGPEAASVGAVWWFAFGFLLLFLVAANLLALHRPEQASIARSAVAVALWCLLALAFDGVICWQMGGRAGLQFCTGYLLEWSLSVDNLFVFAVIFRYFQVPVVHQYRILHWGILGAIVTRLTCILAGAALISRFQFILPLLGLFLVYTAWQLARRSAQQIDPQRNLVFRFARHWLPLAEASEAAVDYGGRFLVRQEGRLRITPPLLVLLIVEGTDVLFAVDSVPAIFGITREPFLVFTSNIFAILGLRAMYFLLAGVMDRFRFLHYGLAAVLAFVGLKMVGESWLPHAPGTEILPAWVSLAVIAGLLGIAILFSMPTGKKEIEN